MPSESPLLTLQRRFLGALREPIFGDSRARSELPPRAGDVSAAFVETADALVRPSASMRPVERLELYHRQYWYRLLDSLAEDFPALRTFLGEEGFWSAAEDYLEAEPPRSFTLRHLGQGLADFLARTATGPDAVHAAELARLEWSLCVAFEAAEHTPVAPSDQAALPKLASAPIGVDDLMVSNSLAAANQAAADQASAATGLGQPHNLAAVEIWELVDHMLAEPSTPGTMTATGDDEGRGRGRRRGRKG